MSVIEFEIMLRELEKKYKKLADKVIELRDCKNLKRFVEIQRELYDLPEVL